MEELLLSAPLGQKAILAVDPGFRTGCKVVASTGKGRYWIMMSSSPWDPAERQKRRQKPLKILLKNITLRPLPWETVPLVGRLRNFSALSRYLQRYRSSWWMRAAHPSILHPSAHGMSSGSRHYRQGGRLHRQTPYGSSGGTC